MSEPRPWPIAPLSVEAVQSGHGDVHTFTIGRSNCDSLTVAEFRWVFERITGRVLADDEVATEWFAEEDR